MAIERDWLTPKEAAKELEVSESAIYAWLNSGQLNGYRIGALRRIKKAELKRFVQAETATSAQ